MLEERVTNLEEVLAHYIQVQERELAAIRASVTEIQLSVAEIRASNARTDLRLLELQEQAEKDRQQIEKDRKDFNKRMAEISDSMGTLIEDMVAPCGYNLAKAVFGGEEADTCAIRVRRRHPSNRGETMELDLLATGGTKVLVVEAKRRLSPAQISEYLQKLSRFPEFFPEHAGKRLWPAVASVYFEPSTVAFLNRQKVFGIAMGDEVMEVINLGQF